MSQLPQVRRLLVEDFMEQKDWIGKLFTPLNSFMEGTVGVLTKGIGIKDNCSADIQKVTLNVVPTVKSPVALRWDLPTAPVSVHVGNVALVTNDDFVLTATVGIQWKYDSVKGLRIVNVVGITPTNTTQYVLTLVIFAG